MKGLLYKDFIALKGKWIVVVSIVVLVGFAVLRFVLPGTEMGVTYRVELEDGGMGRQHMGYMYDVILWFVYSLVMVVYLCFPTMMTKYMFESDERSRSRIYMFSLPFKKEDYVASKYVLYLILYYISESMLLLLYLIYKVTAVNVEVMQKVELLQMTGMGLLSVFLVVHAVQLPAFYLRGSRRAEEINVTITMVVLFFLVVALLFVDFDKVDVVEFLAKHQSVVMAAFSVSFWVAIGIYYLSYRFTVKRVEPASQEYIIE